jgi:hypothetical protein
MKVFNVLLVVCMKLAQCAGFHMRQLDELQLCSFCLEKYADKICDRSFGKPLYMPANRL